MMKQIMIILGIAFIAIGILSWFKFSQVEEPELGPLKSNPDMVAPKFMTGEIASAITAIERNIIASYFFVVIGFVLLIGSMFV